MPRDDDQSKVPEIGTVPPPPGESDAYNAPTRVGPMAAQIAELINAATEEAERKLGVVRHPETPTVPPPQGYEDEVGIDDAMRVGDGALAIAQASFPPPPPAPTPAAPPPLPARALPPADALSREAHEAREEHRDAPASEHPPAEPVLASTPPAPVAPEPMFDAAPPSEPHNYSDPIAHTRPEWSSVSKSEPKLPVASRASRMPLIIGILVVLFALLGVAFLAFGRFAHRH